MGGGTWLLLAHVLIVGMMMGAEARTPGRRRPDVGAGAELFVSSSIAPNKSLFNRGDTAGPFAVGQELTLTCSTQYSPGVLLSWWEDGSQLSAVLQDGGGITSVSVTVGILALQDSGRRFTCREKDTEMAKSIELEVQQVENNVKELLRVLLDDLFLDVTDSIHVKTGDDVSLNCVNQGSNPSAVSWWEDGAELESVSSELPYATKSVLSLKALTVNDRGRSLMCRSLNGQLSRTVILNVDVTEERNPFRGMPYKLPVFSITTVVIFLLALGVLVDFCIKNRSQVKNSVGTNAIKKRAAGEQGSMNIIIGAVRGKMAGKQNNFSVLVNEEDFDDSPVKMVQAAVAP